MNLPHVVSPWVGGPGPYVGAWTPGPVYIGLSALSSAASAYHGYKRHAARDPIPWAVGWGLLGAAFPVVTVAVALAQGFGKRAS